MAATLATHTATTSPAEGAESSLHIDTATTESGGQQTVIRDAEGSIAYPNYIPPETEDLQGRTPTSPRAPSRHHTGLFRKRTRSRSRSKGSERREAGTESTRSPSEPRPVVDKKFVTELPHQGSGQTYVQPSFRRAGTQASQLNTKLRRIPSQALKDDTTISSDDSSSSSSSDEDDDGPHHRRHHHRPHGLGYKNKDSSRRFQVGNEHYHTKGRVSKRDGRLNISLKDTSHTGYLAKALGTAFKKVVPLRELENEDVQEEKKKKPQIVSRLSSASTAAGTDTISCPKLNIVIMVIGSRGDAQPFLKIGKVLKEHYGHRVRIATHPAFKEFVEKDSGVEFFSVGGDPTELMAFMVKNPGMIPTLETVKAGDIGRRRAAMAEMFDGFWRACIDATDDKRDVQNLKMMGDKEPFIADAIIANPPSFAHIHCAEALGIPLHLMFTFPYTPTQAFPHPLAAIKKSNVDPGYTNFISYPLVEMMVWQGLGDLVNDFRVKTLALDPVSTLWAPGATYRLHVPYTYLWSPGLVPKPADWGEEIDISGFVFLDLASTFKPPDALAKFLDAGEPPIYIGFGSIVVDDANRFTEMIFAAVKMAGVRALVSKGWGGLGGDEMDLPENIFMLENTPHDWLFPKVRACVIHGGAGTTAIALKCGRPTMVVPFFGDQHFWGSMIGNAKAGPEAVPYKSLTAKKLADGIKYCLTKQAVKAAGEISRRIEADGDGAKNACQAFHSRLTLSGRNSMRCSILEDRIAAWKLKETNLRLSALAADLLVEKGLLSWKKLRSVRHSEWNDFEGPGEPVTGIAGSLVSTVTNVFGGIGGVPYHIVKSSRERKEKQERKKKREQMKEQRAEKAKEKQAVKALKKTISNGEATNGHAVTPDMPPAQPTEAVDHATRVQQTIQPDGSRPEDNPSSESFASNTRNRIQRSDTAGTFSTVDSYDRPTAEEVAHKFGHGAAKSAKALASAPGNLAMALAQGFHNAPRLYGDVTVRRPPRVTGIRSGLRAAGHEFTYGVYDGWTGVVRLPVRGAKTDGVKGFAKGVGMGLTGFVLKDLAAIIGPLGYTLKGVAKQLDRGRQPIKQIRRARIIEGQREARALSDEERARLVAETARGWEVMRALWEMLKRLQQQGHLRLSKKIKLKRAMGLGEVFETVGAAETALIRLKRGESLKDVLGETPWFLANMDHDDGGRAGKTKVGRDRHHESPPSSNHDHDHDNSHKGEEKRVRISEPQKPVAEVKKDAERERVGRGGGGGLTADDVKTPGEEKENPFSASFRQIEKNKEEARGEEETLTTTPAGAA